MSVSLGSIKSAASNHRVISVALVGVIIVCAVVLGVKPRLSTPWTVGLTVLSAVAGAALGNTLRLDLTESVYKNQARPATRHLFDQIRRLQGMVVRVELHGEKLASHDVDPERASDWFIALGNELRAEIDACATAIDNWSDLATDVREEEWKKYLDRDTRLPEARRERDGG